MGRYAKYDNEQVLESKINAYFKECDGKTKPFVTKEGKVINVPAPPIYTILGLCIYLDIHRDTLSEYQKLDLFSDTIKKAKTKIQANRQEGMLDGSQNPTGCIFDLKHNHKWKDKTVEKIVMPAKDYDLTKLNDEELELLEKLKAKMQKQNE